nr:Biomphalaria glabrata kelch repeat and BTB domain-containing protein 2-like [Biomphalaria glabrata]
MSPVLPPLSLIFNAFKRLHLNSRMFDRLSCGPVGLNSVHFKMAIITSCSEFTFKF